MRNAIFPSVLLLLFLVAGCTSFKKLVQIDVPSPREKYLDGLDKSNLLASAMGKSWVAAGNVADHDSMIVTLPFRETGFFAAAEPQARFYRFDVKDGQVLTLTSLIKTKANATLFIDLFTLEEGNWKNVEHADSTLTITHEFSESGSCLVRLQPELLVNMYYSITLSVTPVLLNPVKGASNKSIGSFYGDPRDGGKRKHEGVDIFAPKGTLVVAPTDGLITSVGNSALGGKTVWMNDVKRGHSYYFAHLDSQIVRRGMKVKQGDAIGLVGNTGNAKNTPSHLHFGVYQQASKDPIAYIRTMEKLVNEMMPDTLFQSLVFRVKQKSAPLRTGPNKKQEIYQELSKDTWVKVIGRSNDWYRVVTAAGKEGYVELRDIIPAENGNHFVVKNEASLLSEAHIGAVPIGVVTGHAVGLASHNNFRFIRTDDGLTGWVDFTKVMVK
jgi:murein DD-endopeptidase MepM/ murein hydrolase activator NlpD